MGPAAAVHPTDQNLRSYGLGELDPASAQSVKQHLESCAECQRRAAEISPDSFLARPRDAHGQPGSTGPAVSSLTSLSMLDDTGPTPKAPPPAADSLPPGLADHPDYEVIRELGQGGMGTVYLAKNRLMGRHEVLKVVSKHMMNRPGALDRFLGEIRHAARLHHTNIVTAYAATRIGESIVFAMEYVEGLDLSRLVKTKGPLPVSNACHYIHQAALGLQHASELGMVHRDIKPSNLMLARQGNRGVIKVLDFGLAKVKSEGAVDGSLTHEGQLLGTPEYVAPEQISDARRADIRADIYSLGCTLYCLLSGAPPFQATSLYDLLQAHHSMDAMPLNLARPAVPIELAALVAKMMAKEPERRFQTPKDVAQALVPFFKKGFVGVAEPRFEMPEPTRAEEDRASTRALSVPAQPTTEAPPPVAPPPETPPAMPSRTEPEWEALIKFKATAAEQAPAVVVAARAPRWLWPSAVAGLLLLGFIVAWATVVRVKTPNGFIELVNLPQDAEVFVDGEKVAVTWPGGGTPAFISVTAGKHTVSVKKDGLKSWGDEVTVEVGAKQEFTVRFAPLDEPPPEKDKADDRLTRAEAEGKKLRESPPDLPREAADDGGASRIIVENPTTAFVTERGITIGGASSPPKGPALSTVAGKTSGKVEFHPLFNGKDLTGWKAHPSQHADWRVKDGVLLGSSPGAGMIYTDRSDYSDFHLRLEARISDPGNSGVFFRSLFGPSLIRQNPAWPDGYEVELNTAGLGFLRAWPGGRLSRTLEVAAVRDQWFPIEVIADGNHIIINISGINTVDFTDPNRRYTSGHIALQKLGRTEVAFRNIQINELNGKPPVPPARGPRDKLKNGGDPADDGFVFLSGLEYSNLRVGRPGYYAVDGTLGRFREKIRVKGEESPHGLFLHPPARGYSEVYYMIDDKWDSFQGAVAIHRAPERKSYDASPLTFEVAGDNSVLWSSRPVTDFDEPQSFSVNVRNVRQLRLRVNCPGRNDFAWAVWLEPRVEPPVNKPFAQPAARPLNRPQKMLLSRTRAVHVDEFNKPRVGLPKDLNVKHDPPNGQADGVYFAFSPGGWHAWNIHDIRSDGTCEVVARVLSEHPSKNAAWSVLVLGKTAARGFRGFFIKINVKGELFIEPNPWPKAEAFRKIDPRMGPIRHPAIKPGNQFNKLLLIIKKRELVICVNDVQVWTPVRFNYDITPAVLEFGAAGPGRKRAEFDRLEIRETIQPEEAPPKTDAAPPDKLEAVEPAGPAKPKPAVPDNPPRLIAKSIGMTLNLIPAGEFMMGSPEDDTDAAVREKPRHRVRISSFYLGVTEVTQAQYQAVMGSNPSHFSATGDGKDKVAGRPTGKYPVELVSWLDAVRFCDALSEKEGRTPFYHRKDQNPDRTEKGTGYRLPTEAEWEYACRAGTTARYCFGDAPALLSEYGWFRGNSGGMTHRVGEKRPNGFGL